MGTQQRAYMGQSIMWGTVLPSRVVYLIEAGSAAGFRRAVQSACMRWGGLSELIVEVDREAGLSRQNYDLVQCAALEAAVAVGPIWEIARSAAQSLGLPLVDIARLDEEGRTAYSYPLSAVVGGGDMLLIAQEAGPLWQVAVAGDVAADEQLFRPSVRRPMNGSEVGSMQDRWSATLLEASASQFEEHTTESVENTSAVIWIADGADPLPDCLEFWNMRALRPRRSSTRVPLLLLPYKEVEAWHAYDQRIAGLLARRGERNVDVVLRSQSVDESELHRIAALWGLEQQSDDVISFGFPLWEGGAARTPPFFYKVNVDPTSWLAARRDWGRRQDFDIHVFSDRSTSVRFRSPVTLDGSAQVLIRLDGEALAGLPRRLATAQAIHPAARWHGDQLQLGVLTDGEIFLELQIPSLATATTHLLDGLTQRWELSDKGRIATALLTSDGGQALLEPGRYDIAMQLFTPRGKELHKKLVPHQATFALFMSGGVSSC